MTTSVPARDRDVARASACGSAPCAPAATIGGKRRASAPRRRMRELEVERDVALGAPHQAAPEDLASAPASASCAAARIASISPASLTARSSSTRPPGGDELDAVGAAARAGARARLTDMLRVVEAEPQRRPRAAVRAAPAAGRAAISRSQRRVDLLGRLGQVAEVGEEAPQRRRRRRRAAPLEPVKPVSQRTLTRSVTSSASSSRSASALGDACRRGCSAHAAAPSSA